MRNVLPSFRISPDGKQVAYNSKKSGAINIWITPIEGGEAKQLTFDNELAGFPAWSPDGKWIGFQLKRGDDTHVGIIPIEVRQAFKRTYVFVPFRIFFSIRGPIYQDMVVWV
jgi:Tol biopolymer transport system component